MAVLSVACLWQRLCQQLVSLQKWLSTVHTHPSVRDTQKWPHINRSSSGVAFVFSTITHIHTYMHVHAYKNKCTPHTSMVLPTVVKMVCDSLRTCYDLWHSYIHGCVTSVPCCVALWAHRCTGSRPYPTTSVATGALYAHRAAQHRDWECHS